MKKIFGVLSLVAILTVAFTSQASVNYIDSNTEFVVSVEHPSIAIAIATLEVSKAFVVFNVADKSVKEASEENVVTDIVSKASTIDLKSFAVIHLPFEVGLLSETSYKSKIPLNLNQYIKKYNYTYGREAPEIISRISSNIGKLTKYNI